jgi:hypothetical protein
MSSALAWPSSTAFGPGPGSGRRDALGWVEGVFFHTASVVSGLQRGGQVVCFAPGADVGAAPSIGRSPGPEPPPGASESLIASTGASRRRSGPPKARTAVPPYRPAPCDPTSIWNI